MPVLRRRAHRRPLRVLTASAVKIDLADKSESRRLRALLQGWQADAWNYRDSIPEIRFAVQFKANAMARLQLFVGVEPETGEDNNPITLDASNIPDQFQSIASQALADLATDEGDRRELLKKLSTSVDVPGESRILGQIDPGSGEETWSIRSTDEIQPRDDGWYMREVPDGPQGVIPWVKLDSELTSISRVWVPHPRFALMADSPMKALLQPCEALLILRRMIRAEGRSRLNRGILAVPDELSIKVPIDDNEDPEADPFFSNLTKMLTEPIGDEGSASAYAPGAVRGPAEILKELRLIDLTRPFEEQAMRAREELVANIAVGLDIPREVIEGAADMNHWSQWAVDDNTFRYHLEPHAITLVDMLTAGYFRERLLAQGVPPEYARRMVVWYDPTELVTHPDKTADALKLHENLALSDAALMREAGFDETDAPSKQEIQVRLLEKMRQWPPNLVMAFLHAWDPSLTAPPMTGPPAIPGISPKGVENAEVSAVLPGRPGAPAQIPAETGTPASSTPAPSTEQPEHGPPPITAAGYQHHRLSRKLAQLDRDLRSRLQTAANAAMLAHLERVGARLRSKVAKDETLRTKIAHRRTDRVSAILGRGAVAAAGVDAEGLMDENWGALRGQFNDWTSAAQRQALSTARQLGGIEEGDARVKEAEDKLTAGRDRGWELLATSLAALGAHLLYNPDPNVGPTDWADLNPDTLVQTGVIRAALGVAGGGDVGVSSTGEAVSTLGEPVGQIGTGATITELLESASMTTEGYEWSHGPALHPFDPHLELDGVEFDSFEDERLANTAGWPGNSFFFPGDHEGDSCDFVPLWGPAETELEGSEQEAS